MQQASPQPSPVQTSPYSSYQPPQRYGYGRAGWDYETSKRIDRTKMGLALLIAGALITAIPFIGGFGTLIAIVGAILIILGRDPFGPRHSSYVGWAVAIYIMATIATLVVAFGFAGSVESIVSSASDVNSAIQALSSAFNVFLIGLVVLAAITGVAYVLVAYALQEQTGRLLLLGAYAAQIGVTIAICLYISPLVPTSLSQAVATQDSSPVTQLQGEISGLGVLSILPNFLYALAYYFAWKRVDDGELPERPKPYSPSSYGQVPSWLGKQSTHKLRHILTI